jgi:hypothetical protein
MAVSPDIFLLVVCRIAKSDFHQRRGPGAESNPRAVHAKHVYRGSVRRHGFARQPKGKTTTG